MITKEINKYKKIEYVQRSYPVVEHHSNTGRLMTKLEYALFIKNLPYQVGDLLVPITSHEPFFDYNVCRLNSIDEIHRFVVNGPCGSGPLCLELEELNGNIRPGRAGALIYKKVMPEHYPLGWKEKLIVDV